jgi:hypothetical protein
MTIKPEVDPADDFDKFSSICRSYHSAFLFFDENKKLSGMYVIMIKPGATSQGHTYLLVMGEFGMFLPSCRQNPAFPLSALPFLRIVFNAWQGQSIWIAGVGYPAGMFVLNGWGVLSTWGQPGLAERQTEMLDLVVELAQPKWDKDKRCVFMNTLPPTMPKKWWETVLDAPMYKSYVHQCPQWQLGYGLPGVVHVHPFSLLRQSVWRFVTRLVR